MATAATAQQIPPLPSGLDLFVADYASLVSPSDRAAIHQLQKVAYNQHDTPVVVVTIQSMAVYGATNQSIEQFAGIWFNTWGVARKSASGQPIQRGILLLVSVGDRRARIELGHDWGTGWDDHCQRIMDRRIVPQFKLGDYSGGIAAGVEELSAMAAIGPAGQPPQPSLPEQLTSGEPLLNGVPLSPIPGGIQWLIIGLGGLLVVVAVFVPEHRYGILAAAGVLIFVALFTYIVLFIIAMVLSPRQRYHGGSGGFSGGGFGGGFSGGGGATGSW